MNNLALRTIRSSIFGIASLLALTFIPAGTINYWQGWAYVATWIIVGSAYTIYVAKHDPALLKRRTEAGISHEKEPAQKVVICFLFAAFFPALCFAATRLPLRVVAYAMVRLSVRRRLGRNFVLYLLSRIESEYVCGSERAR